MSYKFVRENVATFKFKASTLTPKKLTLDGVSPNAAADSIVAGVQGILYIADKLEQFDPEDGIRVVSEDVQYDY